jgi:hypothetical protein
VYGKHPDEDFCNMFRKKPYQGQDLQKATVIILGIDANYTESLSALPGQVDHFGRGMPVHLQAEYAVWRVNLRYMQA